MDELQLEIAGFSEPGIKPINEDCASHWVPASGHLRKSKGIALALADGVSTAEAGREASHTAVTRFIDEYYQTPDTWSVSHSGELVLSTINLRLFRKSHEFTHESKGFLCTFSAAVVKSRTLHFFHVGDSRIYHWRQGVLTLLTRDHVATIAENRTCLARSLGMDNRLNLDYGHLEVQPGDLILLTTDGVHDVLGHDRLGALLAGGGEVETLAGELFAQAMAAGSTDNCSALIARILTLPEEKLEDYSAELTRLPFPPDLEPGMKLDGYRVELVLFASSRSQLYLVTDEASGRRYAMKTPSRNFEGDIAYIDRFVQEEWIGSRIASPQVAQVVPLDRPRSCLYYLMEYVEGVGLDQWIASHQPPSPKQTIALVRQIAEGLKAFHTNEAIHQDLKPANIKVTPEGRAVILDFGSVYVAGLAELQRPLVHEGALGTASYSDPLYLTGRNPGIQGDVYSLATIVYELFTGHLPYGSDIEECRTPADFDKLRYHPAAKANPLIPLWFDGALERGVSFDLEYRYHTIDELMQDLTQPNPNFLREDPVVEKSASQLVFWKLLSGFWFFTLLLVIYLFGQD